MTNQSQEQSKPMLTWKHSQQLLKVFLYQLMLTFLMRSSPLAQTSFTLSLWTVKSVSNASCFFSKPCKYNKNKSIKNFHIWKKTVTAKVHKVLINDDAMKSPKCQQLPPYLDSSKCVSIILTGYQCHFLVDPCLLFLNICYKLLVLQGLLQTLPPAWVKKGKISCSVTLQLLDKRWKWIHKAAENLRMYRAWKLTYITHTSLFQASKPAATEGLKGPSLPTASIQKNILVVDLGQLISSLVFSWCKKRLIAAQLQ